MGEYKCKTGGAVENMPAVANIKTLKGRFIAHNFSTVWAVEVLKSGKEARCCWPVCITGYTSTSSCCKRVNTKNNKRSCVDLTNLAS
jgi:hypothetical protein